MKSRVLAVRHTVVLWLVTGFCAMGSHASAEPCYWEKRQLDLELLDAQIGDFQAREPKSQASALYDLVDASSALSPADYAAVVGQQVASGGHAAMTFAEQLAAWYQRNRTYQGLVDHMLAKSPDQRLTAAELLAVLKIDFALAA